ncbi:hypothetical protein G6F64_013127 [Rhizopus arrhizus]|uniref:Uncharacterized protein n=1 Tax=Rhizopus oryzae TaxID=64495 RepID=A0A9P7BKU8_RHIOR|nr:hypothetical protein G6F64_013127 [Rhizopus arrhizus]
MAHVLVLGVTEVQQGQRLGGGRQRAQLVPRAPAAIALHAVDVLGIRLQAADVGTMVMRQPVFGLQCARRRTHLTDALDGRRICSQRDLQQWRLHAAIGTPGHGESGAGISRRRGDDAVRHRRRCVVAAARRHLGIRLGRRERQRRQRQHQAQRQAMHHVTPAHAPHSSGSASCLAMLSQSNATTPWSSCTAYSAPCGNRALGCCIIQMPSVLATVLPWNAPTGFSV